MAPTQSVFMPVDTALTLMLTQLQANTASITDFTTGSNLRNLFEAFAIVVSANTATADQLQLDSYLDTATGPALDALGANNWLVPRNQAVQSTGQLTITRQSTSGALILQAGWGQLATSPAIAGTLGVSVLTTEDANFNDGEASVVVSAQAVIGGSDGNLDVGTYLTPLAPVNGIDSSTGFQVTTAFTNGVDTESDDDYRARIPLTVQGRVKGKIASFMAGALGVPGVLSASVMTPGNIRSDGSTVPANTIEVYYEGSAGLLSAVQSATISAASDSQSATAYAAVSLSTPRGQQRVLCDIQVYCLAGTDETALAQNVTAALQSYVNSVGLGGTVYLSAAVEAVLAVTGVVSVSPIPPATFCVEGNSGAADIAMAGADSYPNLAANDVLVTVSTLPA